MRRIAAGVAAGFGATAEVDFRLIFAPAGQRPAEHADAIADAAAELVGEASVDRARPPGMGSEDFSFMLEQVPGAYIQLGNGDSGATAQPALRLQRRRHPLRHRRVRRAGGAADAERGRKGKQGQGALPPGPPPGVSGPLDPDTWRGVERGG